MALYSTGDYEKGLSAFDHYMDSCGGINTAEGRTGLVWKGQLYDLMGKRDDAIKCYKKTLELGGPSGVRHDQFGIVMSKEYVQSLIEKPFEKKGFR
jgi:tetratricopeptide (TPR) repeat protein